MSHQKQHLYFMSLALKEAIKARNKNEIPVGAVLVTEKNKVIAKTHNSVIYNKNPVAHAEIKILEKASKKLNSINLSGNILYVTMEPCVMCMGAVIHAKISTLVFGIENIKWGAAGSLYNFALDYRLNHKINIIKGLCFEECNSLVRNFFKNKKFNS